MIILNLGRKCIITSPDLLMAYLCNLLALTIENSQYTVEDHQYGMPYHAKHVTCRLSLGSSAYGRCIWPM